MSTAWTNKAKEELVIISEIVTGGSLKKYLTSIKQPRLKLIKLWCRGILSGLDYLHSQKIPIIHGDLTANSIFIMSSDGTVKISDNFYNKLLIEQGRIIGSPEYMAPEYVQGKYSAKCDIYSFGMNLIEMCTQQIPYQELENSRKIFEYSTKGIVPDAILNINAPEIVEIIQLCLQSEEMRPTAKELLDHAFLQINENPNNYLPVPLFFRKFGVKKSKEIGKINISMIVNVKNYPKDVSFDYCCNRDTPEKVAKEMVEALGLDHNFIIKIAEEIEKRLENRVTELGKNERIQIFKYKTDIFEPNTAGITQEMVVPCLKSGVSLDEKLEQKENIKKIQELLAEMFTVKVKSNGFIDKKMKMLIKKFQFQEGLVTNGIVSEDLVKLLTHRIRTSKSRIV